MRLAWNLFLAVFWAALWGQISLQYLVFGFVIGYGVLTAMESTGLIENKFYGSRIWRILSFSVFFIKELTLSNLSVAWDVLRWKPQFKPAIVKVPLDLRDDLEITFLANVISLTPGTLSLDVSPDRKYLYVHAMFCTDRDDFVKSIKSGFEKRVQELFAT